MFLLLLEYAGMRTGLSTPQTVPASLLSEYEQAVETQMNEHPFRLEKGVFQHQVFLEYVLGWYLTRFSRDLGDLHEEIRRRLLSIGGLLPSPLLGRFALGLAKIKNGEAFTPEIRGEDFGFIYESFLAQVEKDTPVGLILDSLDEAGVMHAVIGTRNEQSKFVVTDTGHGVWFWRRLTGVKFRCHPDWSSEFRAASSFLGQMWISLV